MGYWAGRDSQRFYIENGVVLTGPKGIVLPIDPVTFDFIKEPVVPLPPVEEPPKVEAKVLTEFKDEKKVDEFMEGVQNTKPIEHIKQCRSHGRGGRYTEECPKCDWLKKNK